MAGRRNGWRTLRRSVVFAALLCITGCGSCFGLAVKPGARTTATAKSAAKDRFVLARATKNGAGATYRPSRKLWAPFRVEVTLGLFDPKHANLGDGTFGASVIDASFFGDYFGISVRKSGDGISVDGGPVAQTPVGTLDLPDDLEADIAFELSDGSMKYFARRRGDAEYQLLGSNSAAKSGPYVLSADVSDLPKGVVIGCDQVRVVSNGPARFPTAAQRASELSYTAIDAFAEAMYALDGAAPDRAAAGAQLDLAAERLAAAVALDVPDSKSSFTKLASARKKALALAKGVRGRQGVNGAISAIRAAVKLTGQAAEKLD